MEIPFPYHDYSLPYKEDMIKQFFKTRKMNRSNIKKIPQSNNFPYINSKFNEFIIKEYLKVLRKYYILSSPSEFPHPNIYYQNNIDFAPLYHTHRFSKISSVYYIDPPKGNDGNIEFLFQGNKFEVETKKDVIYFFPSWLEHRPLPQKNDVDRVCVNIDYSTNGKVISKTNGQMW